jgi:hypothetical protein
MAMKPTPTKVVLLMSAAGLGLSWSGVALASRDSHAPPSLALTFGVPARSEQGCSSEGLDGLASCPPSGELLRTIVAESAALPLPLAPTDPSSAANVSFRAFDAYATRPRQRSHEARASDGEQEPTDESPRPEMPITTRTIDGSSRDLEAEADAVALLLLEDPQKGADAAAKGPDPNGQTAYAAQRSLDPAAAGGSETGVPRDVGKVDRGHAQVQAVDASAAAESESPDGSVDARATRARAKAQAAGVAMLATVAAQPSSAHEGEVSAAFTGDQASLTEVFAFQADVRSARIAQVSASEDPASSDSASVERVWASLAEVLGAQLEASQPATESLPVQATAPKRDVALRQAVMLDAVDPVPVVSAPPIVATGNDSNSLSRSSEADDIVVASSHSDKILLSLAALRSGEGSEMGWSGAQTKKTVVVRQSDKVLETLALFKSRKHKRAAFSCTRVAEEETQIATPSEPMGPWESTEQAVASAGTTFAREPDILLDLSPPVADQSVQPAPQAAPARPALSDQPSPRRTDRSAMGSDLVALSSDKLDEVRGGFVTDTGLKVSFGIERAVYIDGNLVATTSLNIADLSKISGGQAQITGTSPGSLALVQSGAGNTFAPGSISSTAAGTVIQNTLDNKQINTITRIDAVVNSSGIMRSINLQSSMRSAIIDSLRR